MTNMQSLDNKPLNIMIGIVVNITNLHIEIKISPPNRIIFSTILIVIMDLTSNE